MFPASGVLFEKPTAAELKRLPATITSRRGSMPLAERRPDHATSHADLPDCTRASCLRWRATFRPACRLFSGSVTDTRWLPLNQIHPPNANVPAWISRSRPDDRPARLQSLADPARCAGGPPLHRRDLRLQRLQRAADARRRHHPVDRRAGTGRSPRSAGSTRSP